MPISAGSPPSTRTAPCSPEPASQETRISTVKGGRVGGDFPVQLIGRDPEVEFVRGFVDDAAVRGGALLVAGGAGVGKTLVVSNAVLALLRDAAVTQPLLVVVDDLQWLDRASSLVLASAVRRLA